jgi:Tol biopolymer transport system component
VTDRETNLDPAAVRNALDRVLASKAFAGAQRSSALLRFIVEEAVAGRAARLKEYALGVDALGRGPAFDPRVDPIARVEASRLRQRLELYYATEGLGDRLVIALPKGGYAPTFTERVSQVEATRSSRQYRTASLWFAVGASVAAAASLFTVWHEPAEPRALAPLVQVDVALGAPGVLASEVGNVVALSHDGSTLVHVALLPDGSTRLYARRLAELEAKELPGTAGARGPFFSPDDRWVGFWAQGQLKKTLVDGGGSPVPIATVSDLLGASWADDDTIVAAFDATGRLMRLPAAGGAPKAIFEPVPGAEARWPQVLPGGAVLFTRSRGRTSSGVAVLSVDGEVYDVVPAGQYGRYLASGHLVYVDRGTLYAAPFDLTTLALTGAPRRVLDDIVVAPTFGYAQLAVADNGTIAYQRNNGISRMMWLDASGAEPEPAVAEPGRYLWPRLSPDGRRVAVSVLEGSDFDLWTYDLGTGTRRRVAEGPGHQGGATWTPDGRFLVYSSIDQGGVFAVDTDSPGPPELLLPGTRVPWTFAPDGGRLAFHEMSDTAGFDLASAAIETRDGRLHASDPAVFFRTQVYETYPAFSPDGEWIAYTSNESDAWEVYVRPFSQDGRMTRVSTRGGRIPVWSRTSRELLYETSDHRLMAVTYDVTNGGFVASEPREWSPHTLLDTGVLANFDVSPDGRVLALLPIESDSQARRNSVTLVLNFFDELERSTAAE